LRGTYFDEPPLIDNRLVFKKCDITFGSKEQYRQAVIANITLAISQTGFQSRK
jgi:hypothetical protein